MFNKKNLFITISCLCLTACISNIFTGANLVYDRHNVYKKSTDIGIAAQIGHSIKLDPVLNCPSNRCFEITVFHGDVLLLGTVPSMEQKQRASDIVKAVGNYRTLYNYIDVRADAFVPDNTTDAWITTQLRAKIMSNSDIDPNPFKIITRNNVVYLLGDVMDDQDNLIIDIARNGSKVAKVVNLLHVYVLKPKQKPMPPPTPNFPIPNNNSSF